MAITATIALSPTTVNAGPGGSGFTSVATVTISNGAAGGPNVPILGVRPIVYAHGTTQKDESVRLGDVSVGGGLSVAFGASITPQFEVVAFAPQILGVAGGQAGPASNLQYDITCEVVCGDGSVVIPTVAVLTVNPSPHS